MFDHVTFGYCGAGRREAHEESGPPVDVGGLANSPHPRLQFGAMCAPDELHLWCNREGDLRRWAEISSATWRAHGATNVCDFAALSQGVVALLIARWSAPIEAAFGLLLMREP